VKRRKDSTGLGWWTCSCGKEIAVGTPCTRKACRAEYDAAFKALRAISRKFAKGKTK
jgi:hypothetical protein